MPRIALTAGHHNTSGGNATEKVETGLLCEAVAAACRARGWDVRVYTPDGPDADTWPGDGFSPLALDQVVRLIVADSNKGWKPDIFLECHTQAGAAHGVFAIYPDATGLSGGIWGNSTERDDDVRLKLGPDVAKRVSQATGLPVWTDGTMSERETGVGLRGFRLGIFGATREINYATRLIIEYGSHDADLAVINAPGFYDKAGTATADAFAAFLGVTTQPVTVTREINGFTLGFGFLAYYEQLEGLGHAFAVRDLGLPLSNEYQAKRANGTIVTVQDFERARLCFDPKITGDWSIVCLFRDEVLTKV